MTFFLSTKANKYKNKLHGLIGASAINSLTSFEIARECLKLIPHEKFSFAKIWLLAAQFEIRQLNLKGARQVLGNAIGRAPKDKVKY